jgi:hypothetical protein
MPALADPPGDARQRNLDVANGKVKQVNAPAMPLRQFDRSKMGAARQRHLQRHRTAAAIWRLQRVAQEIQGNTCCPDALRFGIEWGKAASDLIQIDEIARARKRFDITSRIGSLANSVWSGDKPQNFSLRHRQSHRNHRPIYPIVRVLKRKEAGGKLQYGS